MTKGLIDSAVESAAAMRKARERNAGIDYGMGTTNIDKSNGIRYGVIPAGTVGQAWYDDAESDYGEPTCPKCGNAATTYYDEKHGDYLAARIVGGYRSCADFACESCEVYFEGEEAYSETPRAFIYSGEGYECQQGGDDCDIFVLKSPYYTLAPYCSPCAPGACYLLLAHAGGAKAYCLGHEWFESGIAPYVVYDLEGKIALPARHEIVKTIDGAFMVLVDGVQWGDGPRDSSGASGQTWATYQEAATALAMDRV